MENHGISVRALFAEIKNAGPVGDRRNEKTEE